MYILMRVGIYSPDQLSLAHIVRPGLAFWTYGVSCYRQKVRKTSQKFIQVPEIKSKSVITVVFSKKLK